jgi:hydrophobic/amphiphilic exporter-1 (mainly G- bacteria), HAE1 family
MSIAEISVKRYVLIAMITVTIIVLGVIGYLGLGLDLFPKIDFPYVVVSTVYPGAGAEEIETQISKKIEDSVGAIEGLDKLSSISKEGVSIVILQFKLGTDVKYSEQTVKEKVETVKSDLPADAYDPAISRFSINDSPIIYLSIQGKRDLADIREIMEKEIQPKIEQLDGVGSVSIIGGRKKIVKITIDKAVLLANSLNYSTISNAIKMHNINFPVGEIQGNEKNITVRVSGKFENIKQIEDIAITTSTGKILRLKDIAKIDFTLEDESVRPRVNKENALLIGIYKQSGGNTVKVCDEIKNKIVEIKKELPADTIVRVVSDSSDIIKKSVDSVKEDILLGAFFAIIIVFIFLGNIRSTIITSIALPTSIIGSFFLISMAGFTLNVMTLMALSLSVGLLIDDAIVVNENIFRRLEHDRNLDPKQAAILGTNEVFVAVLATTLAIMAVFIPISFMEGIVGQMFKEFGLTIAFALSISLVVAFTLTPMLSAFIYKKHDDTEVTKERKGILTKITESWDSFYDKVSIVYKQILEWCLKHKKLVFGITIIMFIGSLLLTTFIGKSFMSSSGSLISIKVETYPGAPLDKIETYVKDIENFVMNQKDIEICYTNVGSSGSNTAEIMATLKPLKERKVDSNEMISIIRNYIKEKYSKYLSYKVATANTITSGDSGSFSAPIYIKIKGDNLNILEKTATQIKQIVLETPGTIDVDSTFKPGNPEYVVRIDKIKAEKLGVTEYEIGSALRTFIQGSKVSVFEKDNKNYDMILRMDESDRKSVDDLRTMVITSRDGRNKIPLNSVCTFEYSSGPKDINRENKQRYLTVSGNFMPGYSLNNLTGIQKRIANEVKMPAGYKIEYGGASEQFADVGKQMGIAIVLSILFMYMILASLYNSFIQPFIIMISLPLALIGAILGLLITGKDLDMMAFIGILLVMGLVAKNAILFIDFANQKRKEGMSIRDALLTAGPLRLRPILMTSLAMIFGMLPLALGLGEGSKGRESLPITVIGGLITSTILTLIVIPGIYEIIEKTLEKKKLKKEQKKLEKLKLNFGVTSEK